MPRYTLFIGNQNISSWSARAYLALRATGAPFEMVKVRLRQPETKAEILKFCPSGKVPALKTDSGEIFWDSLAICEILADRHPEAGLLPDDPTARALAHSYAAEMHGGFPDVRDQLSWDYARTKPLPELRPETQTQLERIIGAWEQALDRYGEEGFLFGRFSIADCMYAPIVSRFRTYGVSLPTASAGYAKRIWALPAMQDWLKGAEQEVADGWV